MDGTKQTVDLGIAITADFKWAGQYNVAAHKGLGKNVLDLSHAYHMERQTCSYRCTRSSWDPM